MIYEKKLYRYRGEVTRCEASAEIEAKDLV